MAPAFAGTIPLIKPDERVSRIQLARRLHRAAVDVRITRGDIWTTPRRCFVNAYHGMSFGGRSDFWLRRLR